MAEINLAKVSPLEMKVHTESKGIFEAHNAQVRSLVRRRGQMKKANPRYSEFSKAIKRHMDAARVHQSRANAWYVTAQHTGSFEANETHLQTREKSKNN